MKHTLAVLAFVVGGGVFTAAAQADQVKSHEQIIGVSEAFVPGGFSSETEAYVIASGLFPNSCYHFSRSEVNSGNGGFTHEIRLYATVSEDLCLMVLVPYQQEVRLGKLATGEHILRFINGDNTYFERKLIIE
jgi:hypothetical protein